MVKKAKHQLTFSDYFLQPANSTHRQYEALRAYFVDKLPSAEAARRFGYTPGSLRVLAHQFRQAPDRPFFLPSVRETRPNGKQNRLREQVVMLRKQNLSVYDISRAISREEEPISPAAVAEILHAEGFARLPRRGDDERPESARPTIAEVADARQLDLSPREFRTRFGGLFLFLPWFPSGPFSASIAAESIPSAIRS